jgi:hypothetical protein
MSRRVIREGTQCPDCRGTGYTRYGICSTCDEAGVVDSVIAYVRDGWLYLPDEQVWINGAYIVAIARVDGHVVPGYIITPTHGAIHGVSGIYGGVLATHPDDIAAVTAWLEGQP